MFMIIIKDEKLKKKLKKKILKIEKCRFRSILWVIAHGFWAKIASLYFHPIFFPLIHDDI